MLTAAQEAVLVTVDALRFERWLPTPARIGICTNPPMSTEEAATIACLLAGDGYLRPRAPIEDADAPYYELTDRGDKYVQSVIERDT